MATIKVKAMREEAKAMGIKDYSRMSKMELATALHKARMEAEATAQETNTTTEEKEHQTMKNETKTTQEQAQAQETTQAGKEQETMKATQETKKQEKKQEQAPKKQEEKTVKVSISYNALVSAKRVHVVNGTKVRIMTDELESRELEVTVPRFDAGVQGFASALESALNMRTFNKIVEKVAEIEYQEHKAAEKGESIKAADSVRRDELKAAMKKLLDEKCFKYGDVYDPLVEMYASHITGQEYNFGRSAELMASMKSIVNALDVVFPNLAKGKTVELEKDIVAFLSTTGLVSTMAEQVREALERSAYVSFKDKKLNAIPTRRLWNLIRAGYSTNKGATTLTHWVNGKNAPTKPMSDMMLVFALEKYKHFAIVKPDTTPSK